MNKVIPPVSYMKSLNDFHLNFLHDCHLVARDGRYRKHLSQLHASQSCYRYIAVSVGVSCL